MVEMTKSGIMAIPAKLTSIQMAEKGQKPEMAKFGTISNLGIPAKLPSTQMQI